MRKLKSGKHPKRKLHRTMESLRRRGSAPADADAAKLDCTRRTSLRSQNAATDNTVSERKLSISFGSISIREYTRIPGDNPSVSEGPPITVEWEHQDEYEVDIDHYEQKKVRRSSSQLKLSPESRIEMLKQNGHNMMNIHESTNAASAERKRRLRTLRNMKMIQIFVGAMKLFKCSSGKPITVKH